MSVTSRILYQYTESLVTNLRATTEQVDLETLNRIVNVLCNQFGHVYVTGIGKSSIAAHKCAASLASVGVASHFLHATEALHGDCGSVGNDDILICISDSGETIEVITLIKTLRRQERCSTVISIIGNEKSSIAQLSDYVLTTQIPSDGTVFTYIPTTSTITVLMLCDVLLMAIVAEQRLSIDEFKKNHPGGTLGKITLEANDVMVPQKRVPFVSKDTGWLELIKVISEGKIGCALVVDNSNTKLLGIVTDGDIRRTLEQGGNPCVIVEAHDIMTQNPQTCSPTTKVDEILSIMETHIITMLPVVIENRIVVGAVHIHNVLQHFKDLSDVCSKNT